MTRKKENLLFFPVTLAMALSAGHQSLAQKTVSPERVTQISDAASLVKPGSAPWHLRMSFQLYDLKGKPSDSGTVEEWWNAPGVYRRVVTGPSYSDIIPSAGAPAQMPRREQYLVNLLVAQVIDPVPNYANFKDLTVKEDSRTFGKAKLTCYSVLRGEAAKSVAPVPIAPEYCVDPGTDILRIHFDSADFAAVRNQGAKFRGVLLGFDNALSYAGKHAITGHIEALEGYDPTKTPLVMTSAPAVGSYVPGVVLAGRILNKEQPHYPEVAKANRISGTVQLSAVISKEGAVTLLEVIASPDPSLSDAATSAVKHWTYQPYLLNGQPTEVDTTITVNFNIGPSQLMLLR